jgi:hypothetical protein
VALADGVQGFAAPGDPLHVPPSCPDDHQFHGPPFDDNGPAWACVPKADTSTTANHQERRQAGITNLLFVSNFVCGVVGGDRAAELAETDGVHLQERTSGRVVHNESADGGRFVPADRRFV